MATLSHIATLATDTTTIIDHGLVMASLTIIIYYHPFGCTSTLSKTVGYVTLTPLFGFGHMT